MVHAPVRYFGHTARNESNVSRADQLAPVSEPAGPSRAGQKPTAGYSAIVACMAAYQFPEVTVVADAGIIFEAKQFQVRLSRVARPEISSPINEALTQPQAAPVSPNEEPNHIPMHVRIALVETTTTMVRSLPASRRIVWNQALTDRGPAARTRMMRSVYPCW